MGPFDRFMYFLVMIGGAAIFVGIGRRFLIGDFSLLTAIMLFALTFSTCIGIASGIRRRPSGL